MFFLRLRVNVMRGRAGGKKKEWMGEIEKVGWKRERERERE